MKQDLKENLGIDFGDDGGFGAFRMQQPQPQQLPPSYVQAERANAGIYAGQSGFTPPPSRPMSVMSQASNLSSVSSPPQYPRRPASVRSHAQGPGARGGAGPGGRYAYNGAQSQQQSAFSQWGPPVIAFLGILACLILKLRGGAGASGAAAGGAAGGVAGGFSGYFGGASSVGGWGAAVGGRFGSVRDSVLSLLKASDLGRAACSILLLKAPARVSAFSSAAAAPAPRLWQECVHLASFSVTS